MASNYLQFSVIIPDMTQEEITWVTEKIDFLDNPESENLPIAFLDSDGLGFEIEINNITKELWIYAKEDGSPDNVAYFVQEFINEFRFSYTFSMTWAETCSKPRVGEFSGGWLVVTADKILFGNCYNAVLEAIKRLEREPS